MKFRFQPWQLAALVVVVCLAAVSVSHWRRVSHSFDALALIECLPPDQATHLYIDVDALRRANLIDLLAGSKAAEEPDYRKFVEQTGFDYRSDLDAVAAAFIHGNVYLSLRCRFDWRRLADYAHSQGGACHNTVCTMPGSTADRNISFYPLKSDILALAVAKEQRGVTMIGPGEWKNPPHLPPEPVWISAPSFAFTDVNSFPAGTHSFLAPLAEAQGATFAIGPVGERLQIRIEVVCATPEAAAALARQLTSATDLLKKMIERQHMTPNPRDLSGPLAAGSFQQQDKRVVGTWPIERSFIEAFAAGQVQ